MSKSKKNEFRPDDFVVYPAHGVGRIVSIEEQEVAGLRLEMFVPAGDAEWRRWYVARQADLTALVDEARAARAKGRAA